MRNSSLILPNTDVDDGLKPSIWDCFPFPSIMMLLGFFLDNYIHFPRH
jgi:hypothetical protein